MAGKIDILIKNGLVFDGTDSEPRETDIGIKDDRVVFINSNSNVFADKIIDAKGLNVAPGFIDTHAHSDFTILADPRAEGKIFQGITTEINGNCGLSAAPLAGELIKRREEDLNELGIKDRWTDFKQYFMILFNKKPTLNFLTLTGHGNIRACVIGYEDKKPNKEDLKKMLSLLKKTIKDGAVGLSTGLIYPPGLYSTSEEIIYLCKNISDSRFIYTTHLRSESDKVLEAIEEAIRIGEESGVRVHISHIKTSGEKNWHKIESIISTIEEARNRGINITCDRYPYIAASTDLDSILPAWVYEGGNEKEIERLKNREIRRRIRQEILREYTDKKCWEKIFISRVNSEDNKWMEGKSVAEISVVRNIDTIDMIFNILVQEKLRVDAIFYSMSEENLKKFLSLPYVMIGTDSSARCLDGITKKGKPHPRGFGSFPRFLGRYVRDNSLMSMNKAIEKITKLPAETFGIFNRGVIKEGAYADIVIFDYNRLTDKATFDNPFLKPDGIYYLIINGSPVIWEGELTGIRPGRIL